ncbi:hypothetical protein H6G76_23935 [Nostoc sp. FACHB-152]|uniref:hypothetical protein n=1 Tax=unclassified Nostoc TaxID=2593658 RepID=UPI001685891C|nr:MULTISPECIES: hypothetical protein [unclassified Nostoc]MBD2450155.1 hypothetical protein [Nostoc sp. FACHB-152]MBD2471338.1 hypothetical protein [Nostoc sp. FACHB-145]
MRRQIIYILIVLFSMLIITLWWPVNGSQCNWKAFLASTTQKFSVQASQIVVQPWFGEHHVYGIFMVPDEYQQTPFFVLTVPGGDSYCSKPFGYSQNYNDVFAEPGTHLIRYYLRTRIALRLMLQGLYFQLNDKQNWTLTYPQAKPIK